MQRRGGELTWLKFDRHLEEIQDEIFFANGKDFCFFFIPIFFNVSCFTEQNAALSLVILYCFYITVTVWVAPMWRSLGHTHQLLHLFFSSDILGIFHWLTTTAHMYTHATNIDFLSGFSSSTTLSIALWIQWKWIGFFFPGWRWGLWRGE